MAQVLITLGVVLFAVVSVSAVLVAAWVLWRRSSSAEGAPSRITAAAPLSGGARPPRASLADEPATATEPELFDRVVRVMTLIFLASVGVFVFVGGEFRDNEAAIQLLLAAGMLSIVLLQDLLPARRLGRARYWLEALVAILFIAMLTGLSGGLDSPFVIGFFLVVAGASLSLDEAAPLLLALLAAGTYALVGIAVAPSAQLTTAAFARLLFTVVSLSLLAYLASVVGREQRRAREAAISLSRYDPLTGVYNRAYFFSMLDREIRRAARSGGRFAVLMLDLDDLKPVNDTFGHQQGDALLRAVSDTVQRNVRSTDVAARYGGDEFVVLLSDTEPQGAHVVAEKLRSDIAALSVGSNDRPARTSASIGLVTYPEDGTSIESLIADADKAMYEAKRRGKNQIVGFTTRTERVATPMGEQRTSMLERADGPAPGRNEPPPTPSSRPPGRSGPSGQSGSGGQPGSPGKPLAAEQLRPPSRSSSESARAAATRPPLQASWDSTMPPGPLRSGGPRGDDSPSYVAFPVEGDPSGPLPWVPARDPRDAAGR